MWPWGRRAAPRDPTGRLGRRGERLARRTLRRKGLRILAENYRSPLGEVDLIALDRSTRRQYGAETLVFVEVKTRSSDRYTEPKSAVNADKQARIRKVARYYLAHHDTEEYNVRYDVVSIVLAAGCKTRIEHAQGAF